MDTRGIGLVVDWEKLPFDCRPDTRPICFPVYGLSLI